MNCSNSLFLIPLFLLLIQTEFLRFEKDETEISSDKKQVQIILPFRINDGFHIQPVKNVPENYIPTEIYFEPNDLFEVSNFEFIDTHYDTVTLDKTEQIVLSGSFRVKVIIKPFEKGINQSKKLKGKINYQACDERQCYYPRSLEFEIEFI